MEAKEIQDKIIHRCFANNISDMKKTKLIIAIKDCFKSQSKQIEKLTIERDVLKEENIKLINMVSEHFVKSTQRKQAVDRLEFKNIKLKKRIIETLDIINGTDDSHYTMNDAKPDIILNLTIKQKIQEVDRLTLINFCNNLDEMDFNRLKLGATEDVVDKFIHIEKIVKEQLDKEYQQNLDDHNNN